ncbi:hypothetical protein Mmc1_3543 [Magnetococcus marinus MC-1]|uniref:Uncharacterized protein n=1 Tax=Magnetococcus marinus (strain ATCC BAA-1437 / JCM 17883 / MC-1) TaxID=156889 RepID=A0LDI5_MAGMM|nr:hypothetical protein [Magnetococcus marinus]ABK46028.1 hypothetical protein Mmc1_3543 [Magnetococcus marinus MC-1]
MADKRETMDEARLQTLIEAYGAQATRWPLFERQEALDLLARKPAMQAILAQAQQLDELLDAAPPALAHGALIGRLLQELPRAPRQRLFTPWWPFERVWQPALALAASVLFGVLVGLQIPDINPSEPLLAESQTMETWQLLAYGPESFTEWEP